MPAKHRNSKSSARRTALASLIKITAVIFVCSLTALISLAEAWPTPTALQLDVVHTVADILKTSVWALLGMLAAALAG